MARLVINNAMTINGAFEAPSPDEWLVLDPDSNNVSLEQFLVADAMVLGRKTYEGLAAVWLQLVDDPTLGLFANRLNSIPQVCGVPDLARAAHGQDPPKSSSQTRESQASSGRFSLVVWAAVGAVGSRPSGWRAEQPTGLVEAVQSAVMTTLPRVLWPKVSNAACAWSSGKTCWTVTVASPLARAWLTRSSTSRVGLAHTGPQSPSGRAPGPGSAREWRGTGLGHKRVRQRRSPRRGGRGR
jgi:hypothetical protein